jgi:hypothetical protein
MIEFSKGRVALLVIIAAVIVLAVIFLSFHKPARAPVVTEMVNALPIAGCGVTIKSPLPGQHVTFPLSMSGVIDRSRSAETGCSWTTFEGQGGQARLFDSAGALVAGPFTIMAADWTATTTAFTVSVAPSASPAIYSGASLIIELVPENPSGKPQTARLDVPVVAR